ncbi:MAG: LytR/AlgR family response regulator transcription factor [bacterium]
MKYIETAFKPNLVISLLIGSWLFLFIIIIKPFQEESIALSQWLLVAFGHSIITILCYLLIMPIQRALFLRLNGWSLHQEILILTIFYTIALFPSYWYHKSDLLNGIYSLPEFIIKIFLPSLIVITPLLIFARVNLLKPTKTSDDKIIIKGNYKMDYLSVKLSSIVCISSAQNYVEVYYVDGENLAKKMIRTSLKKIEKEIPSLTRVHRSHLINTNHFVSWKNNNTLSLTQIEIPISKNYKDRLKQL